MRRSTPLKILDAARARWLARPLILLLVPMLMATAVFADTIVLKNGRRITAFNVSDTGDKIHYETSAGELTLPKSIMDHIEKGGMVAMPGTPGSDRSAER